MQPKVLPGDMDIIHQPIDFLGINHYSSSKVSYSHRGGFLKFETKEIVALGMGHTTMDWGIYPQGLKKILLLIKEKYDNPAIIITENGCAMPDQIDKNGQINDKRRVSYLRHYLIAAYEAIQFGVNLKGYFLWSLMDNFEWSSGYSQRFGMVYVDYATQKRTPKQSAYWYQDVITQNGLKD